MAGLFCILASYPQDIIRTRVMCEVDVPLSKRKYKPILYDGGFISCARNLSRKGGFKAFWYGFNACAINYVLACATQLAGYENIKNIFMKVTDPFVE